MDRIECVAKNVRKFWAIKYTGENINDVIDFLEGDPFYHDIDGLEFNDFVNHYFVFNDEFELDIYKEDDFNDEFEIINK